MKQECKDCNKSLDDCTCIEDTIELPNQALKDAAERHSNETLRDNSHVSFIAGAKWQAEKMYSEEDMAESFMACWKANVPEGFECKLSFKEWFKQFSKLKNG